MSHCRCEWRCPLPRLQEAKRVCSASQTRYIGRHKSFSPATSAEVSRLSVLLLSHLYAFIYSYTNLITRSRVTESRRREADPQQHPNGFSPELWEKRPLLHSVRITVPLDGEHLTVSLFAIPKAAPRFIWGEAKGMVRHPSERLREKGHLQAVSDWDTETGECRELGSLLRMSLGIKQFLKNWHHGPKQINKQIHTHKKSTL